MNSVATFIMALIVMRLCDCFSNLQMHPRLLQWTKLAFFKATSNYRELLEQSFSPHLSPFMRGKSDERTSIMDPELMDIPFEGKDVFIPDTVNKIISKKLKSKSQPIIGLTKGSGCGKSRLLEECRIYCDNNLPSVLFQPITFHYKLSKTVEMLWDNKLISLSYGIVLRILSTFYGIHVNEVDAALRQGVNHLVSTETVTTCIEILLHETIKHVIEKYQTYFNNEVKHFVLAIDESFYPIQSLSAQNEDLYHDIRNVLLDQRIIMPSSSSNNNMLNVHLVMSSLNYTLLQMTPSLRSVLPITPGILHATFIVHDIWNKTLDNFYGSNNRPEQSKLMMERMMLLAIAVEKIPRLVEYVNASLTEYFLSLTTTTTTFQQFHNTTIQYDELTRFVFQQTIEAMKQNYGMITVKDIQLYPLLFSTEIDLLDVDIQPVTMIMNSIYTNAITAFPIVGSDVTIIPEASLFRLLGTNSLLGSHKLQDTIINLICKKRKGDLLEEILFQWLSIKSKVLQSGKMKFNPQFSIGEFFGIHSYNIRFPFLQTMLHKPFPIPSTPSDILILPQRLSSLLNMDKLAFLNEMKAFADTDIKITLMKSGTKGNSGDAFDLLMILRDPHNTNKPLVVFIDGKSREVNKTKKKQTVNFVDQYNKVRDSLQDIPDSFQGDIFDSLRNKHYLYLYATDWKFKNIAIQNVDKNCYAMNDNELQSFLTIIYDVYKAARSGSTNL